MNGEAHWGSFVSARSGGAAGVRLLLTNETKRDGNSEPTDDVRRLRTEASCALVGASGFADLHRGERTNFSEALTGSQRRAAAVVARDWSHLTDYAAQPKKLGNPRDRFEDLAGHRGRAGKEAGPRWWRRRPESSIAM